MLDARQWRQAKFGGGEKGRGRHLGGYNVEGTEGIKVSCYASIRVCAQSSRRVCTHGAGMCVQCERAHMSQARASAHGMCHVSVHSCQALAHAAPGYGRHQSKLLRIRACVCAIVIASVHARCRPVCAVRVCTHVTSTCERARYVQCECAFVSGACARRRVRKRLT